MPNIQTEAPIAPGSDTSRDAALRLTDPVRRRSHRLIFAALAAHGTLSREQIASVTGQKEASLCARISELSPIWIEVAGTVVGSSGCSVNAYRLTAAGNRRWVEANRPLGKP